MPGLRLRVQLMTGDRPRLPLACTLTPATGTVQLAAWRAFNNAYLIDTERRPGSLSVRYADADDAVTRLAALVRTEQACCAFATWEIESGRDGIRVTVTAEDAALDALTFVAST